MKKYTFGTPEELVPSKFCDGFHYTETEVSFPRERFSFKTTASGCTVEFPIEDDCQVFGFGLQLKQFNHSRRKLRLEVNADSFIEAVGQADKSNFNCYLKVLQTSKLFEQFSNVFVDFLSLTNNKAQVGFKLFDCTFALSAVFPGFGFNGFGNQFDQAVEVGAGTATKRSCVSGSRRHGRTRCQVAAHGLSQNVVIDVAVGSAGNCGGRRHD